MAAPFWVIHGNPEVSQGRGIIQDGDTLIDVQWWPAGRVIPGQTESGPAGFYFAGHNIVHTGLIEECDEATEEAWGRMRAIAFEALHEWERLKAAEV